MRADEVLLALLVFLKESQFQAKKLPSVFRIDEIDQTGEIPLTSILVRVNNNIWKLYQHKVVPEVDPSVTFSTAGSPPS